MTTLPVALTMGDPAGVGPEIALKAWQALRDEVPFFMIGDPDAMRAIAGDKAVVEINVPADVPNAAPHGLPVLPVPLATAPVPGRPDHKNAPAVIAFIEKAVDLVQNGQALALTTNPISKQVLIEGAKFAYPGHTEFLAHLAGGGTPVMMLAAPELRVIPVTIHIALSQVPAALTPDLLDRTLRIVASGLRHDFGIMQPRIAIAGLNPHAGEGGLMGREEIEVITPVLDRLREEGMRLIGPLSADTMFHEKARESYDVAVCMYHDQALIPIKTLNFSGGVNMTLGLPIVRTSPDHGTAFDIAGRGIADPDSLIAALRLAHQTGLRRAAG